MVIPAIIGELQMSLATRGAGKKAKQVCPGWIGTCPNETDFGSEEFQRWSRSLLFFLNYSFRLNFARGISTSQQTRIYVLAAMFYFNL